MTQQLDFGLSAGPQLRLVSSQKAFGRLSNSTRRLGLRGVAQAKAALAATPAPPRLDLDAA